MGFDFTFDKYIRLCQSIVDAGHQFITLGQYLEGTNFPSKIAIMRHDIDRNPQSALQMARLESELGLCASYYFRHTRSVFSPDLIKQVADLGHEVGYHYETLARRGGDLDEAVQSFAAELEEFRGICPIRTVSRHGSPLSRWDNADIWKSVSFAEFDLLGEAVLSIDYERVAFFSDTGRTWHSQRNKLRHKAQGMALPPVETTDQLIDFIGSGSQDWLYFLVHPNRWCAGRADWIKEWVFDAAANRTKQLLILARGSGRQAQPQGAAVKESPDPQHAARKWDS
jgi:hypothetical protein